jgi:hypothetical protein
MLRIPGMRRNSMVMAPKMRVKSLEGGGWVGGREGGRGVRVRQESRSQTRQAAPRKAPAVCTAAPHPPHPDPTPLNTAHAPLGQAGAQ